MKMKVTVTGEYNAPDDDFSRQAAYGTTDPHKMAEIDAQAEPAELIDYCDNVAISITPEE